MSPSLWATGHEKGRSEERPKSREVRQERDEDHWNFRRHYRNIVELTDWLSPAAAAWYRTYCRFDTIYPTENLRLL
jgi:hypothetical protein